MRCKLTGAEEGPGCDEAAAAAAETAGDCGGGAPPPSTSPTPSTSATSSASPSPSPTPTPSSASPSPSPTPTPSSASPSPSPTPTPSSASSADEEYIWGQEQKFDRLQVSMSITYSQPTPSTSATSSASPSPSPPQSPTPTPSSTSSADEETLWGEEQEVDRLEESFGSTHLSSTCSESEEFCDIFETDDNGFFSNKSKLGDKVPVLTLLEDYENDTIIGKIMLLDEKYGSRRRTAGDGSCFYRSFIFKYLENVVEIKDENERRTEAARLRQCVESYMPACHNEQLLESFSGFESLVNLVEQGLGDGEFYQMDMNEDVTSRILPLLRALTEIEILSRADFYHGFLTPADRFNSVFELCLDEVRPLNSEANNIQVVALANALGIPVILENLDANLPVRLNPLHVDPQVEHEGARNLSPAEQRRLVTLLYRPGHYDIIYPK